MATLILTNPKITVNGVDLSTHLDTVSVEQMYADIDVSTFGTLSKLHAAGLSDNKVTLQFLEDFALASVHATISPLVGLSTAMTVQPVAGATSSVNPVFSFTAWVLQWKPLDGKVGDSSKISVTWPIQGNVTINTT